MMGSVPFPSGSSSAILFESVDRARSKGASAVCCSAARRSTSSIPKLEPFSRDKIARGVKEPSFIQKSENELADYCSTLEGDQSYKCWRAYFELKELEREVPKDEVEHIIRQTDGVKSLVGCLHGIGLVRRMSGKNLEKPKDFNQGKEHRRPFPIPDGLPKSREELEEEQKAMMPESPYTRLLRSKGRFPAWYSPAPDHETD